MMHILETEQFLEAKTMPNALLHLDDQTDIIEFTILAAASVV